MGKRTVFYVHVGWRHRDSNIYDTVLDPTGKMAYFKKNWPAHLHADVLACAEEVVG
jgi:hypothetical protein